MLTTYLMKARRIKLLLLLVSWMALACVVFLRSSAGIPLGQASVIAASPPLENSTLSAQSLSPEEMPLLTEAASDDEGEAPVQSLEERGDAMLFESEALLGTPFDQAVVRPFD